MFKLFCFLIIFLAILSLCGSKSNRKSSKVENEDELPFKIPNGSNSSSITTDKSTEYREHIDTLFSREKVIDIAYRKFCKEIPEAKKHAMLPRLFNRFFSSSLFHNIEDKEKVKYKETLRKFIAAAKASDNEELRMLYSSFSLSFSGEERLQRFYLNSTKIRPGEKLRLHSYYNYYYKNKFKKQKFIIDISHLTLDKYLKPTRFKPVRSDTLSINKFDNTYECKLDSGGIYKVIVHNDIHFQQFFVQGRGW